MASPSSGSPASGAPAKASAARGTTAVWIWVAGAALAAVAAYGVVGMMAAQGELETVKGERFAALKQAEDAAAARDALRQQIDEVRSARAEAESLRLKIEADVKAASTRVSELQRSADALTADLAAARGALDAKVREVSESRQQLDAANAALALAEANAAASRKEAEANAAAAREEMESLKARMRESAEKLAAAEAEAEKSRAAAAAVAPAPQPAPAPSP